MNDGGYVTTVTEDQLELLAAWYRSEYRKRTKAIKEALADVKIDWLDPGTRVSLTELSSYAQSIGMPMSAQDRIDWFHYINQPKGQQ